MHLEDNTSLIALETILHNNMQTLKDQQVMILENVAAVYEVSPEYFFKQVNRNNKRFPKDFMIYLTSKEQAILTTTFDCAFTEKGILMAGGILHSKKAIKIHIQLINRFVKLYKENTSKDNENSSVFEILTGFVRD